MKKEKFWCRLEQNQVTGGPAARVFAENAENGPKFQKWPFLGIFRKFQKHEFCTIICHQNAKFGGPGVKNGLLTAKNVFTWYFENIDLLNTRKLQKYTHAKPYSSYSSQCFLTGLTFLESQQNCAHNLFVRF